MPRTLVETGDAASTPRSVEQLLRGVAEFENPASLHGRSQVASSLSSGGTLDVFKPIFVDRVLRVQVRIPRKVSKRPGFLSKVWVLYVAFESRRISLGVLRFVPAPDACSKYAKEPTVVVLGPCFWG